MEFDGLWWDDRLIWLNPSKFPAFQSDANGTMWDPAAIWRAIWSAGPPWAKGWMCCTGALQRLGSTFPSFKIPMHLSHLPDGLPGRGVAATMSSRRKTRPIDAETDPTAQSIVSQPTTAYRWWLRPGLDQGWWRQCLPSWQDRLTTGQKLTAGCHLNKQNLVTTRPN